jgi:hypothetical protein
MDSILEKANNKLSSDLRIYMKNARSFTPGLRVYSIKECPDVEAPCRTALISGADGTWTGFAHPDRHHSACIGVFLDSLPSMDTFLQRHLLADALTVDYAATGCLFCLKKGICVNNMRVICLACGLAHSHETGGLVEKYMLMGEVLGGDCAGVVAGYMLYFFAGEGAEK